MTLSMTEQEKKAINTIRTLSMDGVQAANSGHPGTPMALAPVGYLLFNELMNYDPAHPRWLARDRFVLSAGHASMLIYSLLHLSGVRQLGENGEATDQLAVTLDDIRNFRQIGSKCAGHPEFGHVTGVETTTGPLGQGIATSVGMAIAEKWFAGRYNQPNYPLFDSKVYAVCGDGDMMEGISSEAASLAGHLKLSNLCWIYDDNKITIEGDTSLAFTEDVAKRFDAYGWQVLQVNDVNDLPAMRKALETFQAAKDRPTLIIAKSVIAFGSPHLAGSHKAHGAPLGEEEIKQTKTAYGMNPEEKFAVSDEVYKMFEEGIFRKGTQLFTDWRAMFETYQKEHPALSQELSAICQGRLPEGWDKEIETFPADSQGMASRVSSGKVLNQIAKNFPWMLGGSADLAPSNNTDLKFDGAGDFSAETPSGRNFHFGIREFAMAAIANGLTLSGLRTFCATFFVFADYLRPAIRLSALMRIPTLYIFTHDSIGVGEDGPTHQPIEHLASLRAIPNVNVIRPADANEVAEAYKTAIRTTQTPTVLVLTRQNLPTLDRTKYGAASGVSRGAYVLADAENGQPELIFIGTGSEVGICLEAYEKLTAEGITCRVVSMPSQDLFEQQSETYKEAVLPSNITARVAVEMGCELGWHKYVGSRGRILCINTFGASGPACTLFKHYGFTAENLVKIAKETRKS
ncbi:MAG: transketolase [Planctomycetaceae bacterium]|jgi:transketolase|nr:transketolase [Planctomycetaceae bacterium]